MLSETTSADDFWCPTNDNGEGTQPKITLTDAERTALGRFGRGDWVPDALIERLRELGLIEKVFDQPLLTRLGRSLLGLDS